MAKPLYNRGKIVTLQWIPAHEGVKGNEMAHKCAQQAARKKARLVGEGGPRLKSRALKLGIEWIKAERVRHFDKL